MKYGGAAAAKKNAHKDFRFGHHTINGDKRGVVPLGDLTSNTVEVVVESR
ncbi:hypothetical protein IJ22_10870 [Paenibacillus naphthalenovorans]|uniref:Uncharacterized protein n=1 Tax=Paenibacillus naphthalenovorans TaxID=162209 RepID=A0A0U2U4P1_9BACL|nr:hypothetical protein IJ22_10870 [Paenibacillus naphthalenovorans]